MSSASLPKVIGSGSVRFLVESRRLVGHEEFLNDWWERFPGLDIRGLIHRAEDRLVQYSRVNPRKLVAIVDMKEWVERWLSSAHRRHQGMFLGGPGCWFDTKRGRIHVSPAFHESLSEQLWEMDEDRSVDVELTKAGRVLRKMLKDDPRKLLGLWSLAEWVRRFVLRPTGAVD